MPHFPVPKENFKVARKSVVTLLPFAKETASFGAVSTCKEVFATNSAETKLTLAPLSNNAKVLTKGEHTTEIANYNIATCSSNEICA